MTRLGGICLASWPPGPLLCLSAGTYEGQKSRRAVWCARVSIPSITREPLVVSCSCFHVSCRLTPAVPPPTASRLLGRRSFSSRSSNSRSTMPRWLAPSPFRVVPSPSRTLDFPDPFHPGLHATIGSCVGQFFVVEEHFAPSIPDGVPPLEQSNRAHFRVFSRADDKGSIFSSLVHLASPKYTTKSLASVRFQSLLRPTRPHLPHPLVGPSPPTLEAYHESVPGVDTIPVSIRCDPNQMLVRTAPLGFRLRFSRDDTLYGLDEF